MGMFGLFKPNVEKMEKIRDIDGLIKALGYNNYDIQNRASEALGRVGEAAIDPLIHALMTEGFLVNEGFDFRWRAAEALGNTRHAKAVEPLIQALTDRDEEVRKHTVKALGRIRDAKAIQPLVQAMRDESCSVRSEAAEALDELSWKPKSDEEQVHYLIARAAWGKLIILGEPAIDPLIQILTDKNSSIREAAEVVVEKIKANIAGKSRMTKRLVHVVIYTEEPFEPTKANISSCLAKAFPEEFNHLDLATGDFALLTRTKPRDSSIANEVFLTQYGVISCSIWRKKRFQEDFSSWIRSVRKSPHYLPRHDDLCALADTDLILLVWTILLESMNPQFTHSVEFIREWSVVDGRFLVIGIYSLVPE